MVWVVFGLTLLFSSGYACDILHQATHSIVFVCADGDSMPGCHRFWNSSTMYMCLYEQATDGSRTTNATSNHTVASSATTTVPPTSADLSTSTLPLTTTLFGTTLPSVTTTLLLGTTLPSTTLPTTTLPSTTLPTTTTLFGTMPPALTTTIWTGTTPYATTSNFSTNRSKWMNHSTSNSYNLRRNNNYIASSSHNDQTGMIVAIVGLLLCFTLCVFCFTRHTKVSKRNSTVYPSQVRLEDKLPNKSILRPKDYLLELLEEARESPPRVDSPTLRRRNSKVLPASAPPGNKSYTVPPKTLKLPPLKRGSQLKKLSLDDWKKLQQQLKAASMAPVKPARPARPPPSEEDMAMYRQFKRNSLKMKKVHAQLSTIDPPPARRLSHGEKSLANTLGLMETPFQPLNKIKRELKTHGLTHQ